VFSVVSDVPDFYCQSVLSLPYIVNQTHEAADRR
jgi:hypothetical protein